LPSVCFYDQTPENGTVAPLLVLMVPVALDPVDGSVPEIVQLAPDCVVPATKDA